MTYQQPTGSDQSISKQSIRERIADVVVAAAIAAGIDPSIVGSAESIAFEHPAIKSHGDFATSIALSLAKKIGQNPRELATKIVQHIHLDHADFLERIEVAGPGFLNFFLSKKYFGENVLSICALGKEYGKSFIKKNEVVFVEHTQPNTNKPLHIGHLRNSVLGMCLFQILKTTYAKVESTNINNDRGIANIKGMWAFLFCGMRALPQGKELTDDLKKRITNSSWSDVLSQWVARKEDWRSPNDEDFERPGRGDYFVGKYYVLSEVCGEDSVVGIKTKNDWAEMLQSWENPDDKYHGTIIQLWKKMNDWFYEGSRKTLNKLGVIFTVPEEYESELYQRGRVIVEEALKNGVQGFRKLDDGAIQVSLEKYHLPDKILVRRDGTAIYMTFDIELTRKRVQEMHIDKGIWVVGSDQELHFRQLFAICELLGLSSREKLFHFSYGMVRLTTGKMSSRKGVVIYADDVLAMATEKARKYVEASVVLKHLSDEEKNRIAEQIGIGAVKYAMLRIDPHSTILFDLERSVAIEGNSGPYIQYTFARTASVLEKAAQKPELKPILDKMHALHTREDKVIAVSDCLKELLGGDCSHVEGSDVERLLYQFPEVVERAAKEYAPHHLCTYLFELAQSYNTYYATNSILDAEKQTPFRLALTTAVGTVIQNGLSLLGIESPKSM